MSMTLNIIKILFSVLFPLFLIWQIAFKKQENGSIWLANTIFFVLVILLLWATVRWDIVSVYLRNIVLLLLVFACFWGYRHIAQPAGFQFGSIPKAQLITTGSLIIVVTILLLMTFRGYYTYKSTVQIISPLRNGNYYVGQGGASPLLNGHFLVKPQTYAVDFLKLGRYGRRASFIFAGTNLYDYAIFGETVYAPSAGEITVVVDKYDDLTPPQTDIINVAGNHVLIKREDNIEILLAHLKKGSIKVNVGDIVTVDTVIGQVGNTGNTSEPHLHMHLERGGKPDTILNGEGVPFCINGNFMARGNIVKFKNGSID